MQDERGVPRQGTFWREVGGPHDSRGPFIASVRYKWDGKEARVKMNYYENGHGVGFVPTEKDMDERMGMSTVAYKLVLDLQAGTPVHDISRWFVPWDPPI